MFSLLYEFLIFCISPPCRGFLTKKKVPPTSVSYSHSQQHSGRGDCGRPAYSAFSRPVEQPDKRLHQHSAELHRRRYGKLPLGSSKNDCIIMDPATVRVIAFIPLQNGLSSNDDKRPHLLHFSVSWRSISLILRVLEWAV